MEKVCPILLQSLTKKQLEAGERDPYNPSDRPKTARCIRFDCAAYDNKKGVCKYFGTKISY